MTSRSAGALALAAVLALGACGSTYVDTDGTVPASSPGAAATSVPAVDPEAPLDELLADLEQLMSDLDERIIDDRAQVETIRRIDAVWTVAEQRIRAADPDDVFNFEQAIELARSGVARRRPADASKGYKILVAVSDAYLAR